MPAETDLTCECSGIASHKRLANAIISSLLKNVWSFRPEENFLR